MPNANVVIPIMEGTVGRLTDATRGVADWVETMRNLIRKDPNRESKFWTFLSMLDVDQSEDVLQTQLGGEDEGSVSRDITDWLIYGVLIAVQTGETGDAVVVTIVPGAAAGSVTNTGGAFDFDEDTANTGVFAGMCPASDGTSVSYQAYAFPGGIRQTCDSASADEIYIGASDNESNDVAANGVNVYVVGKIIRHD